MRREPGAALAGEVQPKGLNLNEKAKRNVSGLSSKTATELLIYVANMFLDIQALFQGNISCYVFRILLPLRYKFIY